MEPTMGSESNAPTPRRRAATACLSCRSRKVRCDVFRRGIPCTNCHLDSKCCTVNMLKARRALRSVNATKSHPLWHKLDESAASFNSRSPSQISLPTQGEEIGTKGLRGISLLTLPVNPTDNADAEAGMCQLSSPTASTPSTEASAQTRFENSLRARIILDCLSQDVSKSGWRCPWERDEAVNLNNYDKLLLRRRHGGLYDIQGPMLKGVYAAARNPFDAVVIDVEQELYDVLTTECPWFGA